VNTYSLPIVVKHLNFLRRQQGRLGAIVIVRWVPQCTHCLRWGSFDRLNRAPLYCGSGRARPWRRSCRALSQPWPVLMSLANSWRSHRHDAAHRDHLAWIALEILDVFIDFVLCRPTVAFDAFADKRNSRQATFFSRDFNQITERPSPAGRGMKVATCGNPVFRVHTESAKNGYKRVRNRLIWSAHVRGFIPLREQDKILKSQDYLFSVAPMMDWSESSSFSDNCKAACARCVHQEIMRQPT
jgi:hypothetical protein